MGLRLSKPNRARLRGPGRLGLSSGAGATQGQPGTGTGTLSVVEPPDQKVYQRVGTSKIISVSGNFTGSVTQVQMRYVPVGTSLADASAPWTDVPTNVAAQTFAGSLNVQQGGMYIWQARDKVNTNIAFAGTKKFGVGIICVDFGQSNTVNHFTTAFEYPSGAKTSIQFTASAYKRLGNIADSYPPSTRWLGKVAGGYPNTANEGGSTADGPVYFANMLTAELGIPVCLINSSNGGSPIDYWINGQPGWTNLSAAVNAAGGDIELAILYQGESNAHSSSAAFMQNAWTTIQNQFYALTGRNATTMKLGMVSLGPGSYSNSIEGEFGAMRVNQATFSRTTAGWFYAAGIHDGDTPNDYVHISGESHAKLGRRMARSVLALFGKGVSGTGPRITGATISGATITVTVQHAGGTALKDGAGGTGSALTGFTAKDNGTPIPISSTAITGLSSFILTLASTPTGTVTLEYGITDVPHGAYGTGKTTFVPASEVVDNVSLPNMTAGCPLQPCAAFTVTGG
jgi:hypothetical protein